MDASPPEVTGLKKRVNVAIRDAIGLSQNPPPICQDPDEAYTAIDSVARLVHGDLASMVIGGLASLFLQMLHPRAMAGGLHGRLGRRLFVAAEQPLAGALRFEGRVVQQDLRQSGRRAGLPGGLVLLLVDPALWITSGLRLPK